MLKETTLLLSFSRRGLEGIIMKLWLLIAIALLSAVSASYIPSYATYREDLADLESQQDVGLQQLPQQQFMQQNTDRDAGELQEDQQFMQQNTDPDADFMQQNTDTDAGELQEDEEDDVEEDGTAVVQWNNAWDGPLHVQCRGGEGLFAVMSIHDNYREDRLYDWRCQRVLRCGKFGLIHTDCKSYKINTFDSPMHFRCPAHHYLTGLKSYHHNGKEDREWFAQCCRTPGVCLGSCRESAYVNDWDQPMFYIASDGVFTGLYSFHDNRKEDRRWRIESCRARRGKC